MLHVEAKKEIVMSSQLYARAAVGLTALILFGGMTYLGYRFIQDVGHSADRIESKVGQPGAGNMAVNSETLSAGHADAAIAASFNPLQSIPDGVSNGQDVVIGAGELVYRGGKPFIRTKLLNQGGFTATSVFVSFALYLDNSETPVAKVVGLAVPLETPLAVGGETVVNIPIGDELWRSETVARAAKRRVLAQVIGVSDGDRDNADYPQLSSGVFLSQTQNNWTQPETASAVVQEQPLNELVPGATASPNIQVQTDADAVEPPAQAESLSLEEAKELMQPDLPTGEARILSVEVHEYGQGGEQPQP